MPGALQRPRPGIELETKIPEDYAKFYNHGVGPFSVIVKLRIIFSNLRFKLYCAVIYPTSKRAKYISILISSRDLTNGVLFDPLAGLGWAEWAGLGWAQWILMAGLRRRQSA